MPSCIVAAALVAMSVEAAAGPWHVTETPTSPTVAEPAARGRFAASFGAVAGVGAIGLTLDVAGAYAVRDFEVFAGASAIAFASLCIEGCRVGLPDELALGNTVLGARYIVARGSFVASPAIWGWLPTATSDGRWWPHARKVMTSARDSRLYLDDGAVAGALDLAWRSDRIHLQGQLGAAFVADRGPQLDNAYAALGAGGRITRRTALFAEWRVDAYPRHAWIHGVGVGMSRGDHDGRTWRLRLHVARTADGQQMTLGAGSLAVDMVQPW